MKKPHAQWLTLHKADIDQYTSIEILWQTEFNTLNLLVFRIDRRGSEIHLTTEEIGPYHCLAELRQKLRVVFGELPARRICHNAGSWLTPGTASDHAPTRRCYKHQQLKKSPCGGYEPQGSPEIAAPGALPSVAQTEAKKKIGYGASARLRRADCACGQK